ncbi:hypothetical protein A3I28_03750 [Candidatus Giovannonibacteria bacterium RIFCSPLOWO2_02_FULL_43_37]|uniref:histidine kinase n=2 Tax=Candidatus Giovannoniibacteriota TaxID=1752738 RepID=A0A0G1IVK0_9BACT|nr:MAG: Multi-sensor signal transduction histidine kinase [Candidatus Giovannonibacteria bacterium GW2011_GWC2_43_8]KKT62998.1 MAG: Multi-sensor signal transduction histidine kinase [Candidatus Giovannonibacteria bacterium GW2011_GWA2_44_26]OGF69897.1 MAG: hypothetical protein A3C76_02045 [Candidatus Giovannonibacteria bacterium RIFCSPHIGHO2_02_FULL_44_51]OGF86395.1 MAG: hypothetical protein A3I28_03750 [Candidatus Giovannonibacteria bacterium RIFCSPLOWO2_02_FULL_43_37]OGF91599.1 MAG: hypotheti
MRSFSEFSIAKRSQLWFLGVVAVLTIVSANIAWLFPTRDELSEQAYLLHRVIAIDVKNQLFAFLSRYERSLSDGVDVLNQIKERKEDIISRLLKENQPFESLTLLDNKGNEVFKNHRFLLISESDLKDRSEEILYKTVKEGRVYRGPVEISGISEPIITIAVPVNTNTGFSALVAEINLKFFLDVVRNVSVGKEGVAYVVDENGYVIAHPNSSLVFGRANFIDRKIIAEAVSGREADTRAAGFNYTNERGENMLAVALPFELMGWAVVVEDPDSAALGASSRILNVAIISFILEILLVILLIWNYLNLIRAAALFYGERNQREAILNSLSDGVIEYDSEFQIVLMNPRAEELLAVHFKDIGGMAITPDFAKNNPQYKSLVELMYPALAPYSSSIKEVPGTHVKTMEIHTSSPELKMIVTLTQVIDQNGSVRGFLKILHDISRERLLGRIKSEFVSIAAHQLRTPLSAIKWTLKLLLDGDAGALNKEQTSFLERGYDTNEKMIKLVNDLLSVARIEEGRFGYDFQDINFNEFLEAAIKNYADIVSRKSINLKFEKIDGELPLVYADSEKLSLALNNLLDNAVKYTPAGGKVLVKLERKGNYALVSIMDTGVGIPDSEQPRVFSKFFRASNVIKMETEGTGLGLFIVHNIIKRHGGDIHFTSHENHGATFIFTLPLKKELVPKEEAEPLEEFLENV